MNRELINQRISPRQAIVIYHDKRKREYYLESREIKSTKSGYSLMAAVPMAETTLAEMAKVYIKKSGVEMAIGGLIAEHLLYTANDPGRNVVIWFRPSMKRRLNFDKALRIKGDALVTIPATLYVVNNSNLLVFALMNDERPNLKTKLYRAPFFNIYDDGRVCLGTAAVGKVKAKTFELEAERFEKAFYMAEQNGGLSNNVCKTALAPLWTSLLKRKGAFPAKRELIQHPKVKTLEDLLTKIVGSKKKNYEEDDYGTAEDWEIEDDEDIDLEN